MYRRVYVGLVSHHSTKVFFWHGGQQRCPCLEQVCCGNCVIVLTNKVTVCLPAVHDATSITAAPQYTGRCWVNACTT